MPHMQLYNRAEVVNGTTATTVHARVGAWFPGNPYGNKWRDIFAPVDSAENGVPADFEVGEMEEAIVCRFERLADKRVSIYKASRKQKPAR